MKKTDTFEKLLESYSADIPVLSFLLGLVLAILLAYLLRQVYIRYGRSLSNREGFSRTFLPLATTTMLIITIVKSSLALSLGLVGALSIVRFRAAIKEPEELAYLFLCIAIGLGLGADQFVPTLLGFAVIAAVLVAGSRFNSNREHQSLHLVLSSDAPPGIDVREVVEALKPFCTGIKLKRFDETGGLTEASFTVTFRDFEHFVASRARLQELGGIKISFVDTEGIL